jgi:hypothetical protein
LTQQVFGLVDSGLKIQIAIHPDPQSVASRRVVPLDHTPTWKVTKNPFMAALSKKVLQNRDPNADAMHAQTVLQQDSMAMNNLNVNVNPMGMAGQMQQQEQEVIYAFGEMEDVRGVVHLRLPPGKKFDHLGVKVQFVGRVEMVSFDGLCVSFFDLN